MQIRASVTWSSNKGKGQIEGKGQRAKGKGMVNFLTEGSEIIRNNNFISANTLL
jgi:hypothetical protein